MWCLGLNPSVKLHLHRSVVPTGLLYPLVWIPCCDTVSEKLGSWSRVCSTAGDLESWATCCDRQDYNRSLGVDPLLKSPNSRAHGHERSGILSRLDDFECGMVWFWFSLCGIIWSIESKLTFAQLGTQPMISKLLQSKMTLAQLGILPMISKCGIHFLCKPIYDQWTARQICPNTPWKSCSIDT
jgi:hypothetical protein